MSAPMRASAQPAAQEKSPALMLAGALVCGFVFGAGLLLSGMTQPSKVMGFLDLLGAWDPSLAFVMGGAMAATTVLFRVARRRTVTLSGLPAQWPQATAIDAPLILGSAVFGIGWGLAGYCPGPALVSLPAAAPDVLVFVAAMLAGMGLHALRARWSRRPGA